MVSQVSAASPTEAFYRAERRGQALLVMLEGDWTTLQAARIDDVFRGFDWGDAATVEFDGAGLAKLDSTGAWLVLRARREAQAAGKKVAISDMPDSFAAFADALEAGESEKPKRGLGWRREAGFTQLLERIGRGVCNLGRQGYDMLGYLGLVTVEAGETVVRERRLRFAALAHQIEETGISALPILGLLALLLGVVIAYQGVDQLKKFGAEIFTVNLVGVSILREIGVLIAAIIVAGRSGSAFTAHIGTMKLNQEVDALQTMGINIVEVLVLPRVLGLLITLPLLTLYSDLMGLIGGAMMCYFDLDITIPAFIRQLHDAVTLQTFMVGMIKAPVFAFLIALVGCFEGLRVEGSADSVGRQTTRSVVEAIFLVIIFDAGFSILFSILGW